MDVAVPGVENVRDAKAIFVAGCADEAHDLRQLGARHHAVLREIIWTEPADRAERALARLPQQRTLVVGFGDAYFPRTVLAAAFDDPVALLSQPRGTAVESDA